MRCPSLSDLPPATAAKVGWPWTQDSPPLPGAMPDGRPWPRISIVTPSYNQGRFIEETIRSVLLQGYPNLEYLVIDGGSTDESLGIIQKYAPWLAYWASEPDRGQAHAINKGFRLAHGDIVAWLNSDDAYVPRAFSLIAPAIGGDGDRVFVYGDCQQIDELGRPLVLYKGACEGLESFLLFRAWVLQPATFFRRSLLDEVGYLDDSFRYAMDIEFFLRVVARHAIHYVLANYRVHPASKTSQAFLASSQEHLAAVRKYWGASGMLRRQRYFWAARKREANAHLHCSYLNLVDDRRTAGIHIARAVALYPPLFLGRAGLSQLLQLVIGRDRAMALKKWLWHNEAGIGPSA